MSRTTPRPSATAGEAAAAAAATSATAPTHTPAPAPAPAPARPAPKADDRPWWRYGHVWLVIGGPAVVVLASMITIYVALSRPDPVLAEDAYRKGVQVDPALVPQQDGARALMPAVQGRNHAVSPAPPSAPALPASR